MNDVKETMRHKRREELIHSFTSFLSNNLFALVLRKLFDTDEERRDYFNSIMGAWERIHKENIEDLRKQFEKASDGEKLMAKMMGVNGGGEELIQMEEELIEEIKSLITEDYEFMKNETD